MRECFKNGLRFARAPSVSGPSFAVDFGQGIDRSSVPVGKERNVGAELVKPRPQGGCGRVVDDNLSRRTTTLFIIGAVTFLQG